MVMSEHFQQNIVPIVYTHPVSVFATYLCTVRFSTKNLVVARPRTTAPVPQSGEVLLAGETVPSPLGKKVRDLCEPRVLWHELDMDGRKIWALFRAVSSLKPFCGVYWSSRVLSTGREQPPLNLNTALRRAVLSKLSVGGFLGCCRRFLPC